MMSEEDMNDGYTDDMGDGPIGDTVIVEDFLPPPHELVFKEDLTKVTLALSSASVNFFKKEAKKAGVPYQRMIRALIDEYAAGHKNR